jgi:hypothetical protein
MVYWLAERSRLEVGGWEEDLSTLSAFVWPKRYLVALLVSL